MCLADVNGVRLNENNPRFVHVERDRGIENRLATIDQRDGILYR